VSERISVAFAIPGDLATPTGGYVYDRRVLERLADHGIDAAILPLPGSFPDPSPADLAATRAALEAVPAAHVLLVDGLAWGAFPAAMAAGIAAPLVALCHHPLGVETGLSPERARQLIDNETATLALARRIIVTSPATKALLVADFGAPADRIDVAEPGVDRAPPARGSGGPGLSILAVGAVTPRKGFDVLVEALAACAGLDWRLTIAGPLDRAPEAVAALRSQCERAGLTERVRLAGPVTARELETLYDCADLFVSASLYEGYGMAIADAMARALPIVATTGGAAADTLPDGAGLKVAPGDAQALGAALRQALSDQDTRRRLSAGAARAAQELPKWDDAAQIIARTLREARINPRINS
jgi:glycosyltransferase involved in cell wall biosynthesis